jgi:hypothetical protein
MPFDDNFGVMGASLDVDTQFALLLLLLLLLVLLLLLSSSKLFPVDVSKYERRHKIQSNPALANTKMFSVSKNIRNMSIITLEMWSFFVVNVPNNGRHPDLISVRCASTISMQQVMI